MLKDRGEPRKERITFIVRICDKSHRMGRNYSLCNRTIYLRQECPLD